MPRLVNGDLALPYQKSLLFLERAPGQQSGRPGPPLSSPSAPHHSPNDATSVSHRSSQGAGVDSAGGPKERHPPTRCNTEA